jgi:peroxiredoxin
MNRRFNWQLWSGFALSAVAFATYFALFIRFPTTRDFPFPSLLLFAIAIVLLIIGLRSAQRRRPLAWIVTILGFAIAAFFCFAVFIGSKQLPVSETAIAVGAKAPDFVLLDINRKPVALSQLLAIPSNKGVVLIFYRGYWWPFCNSELRGIEQRLADFRAAGVQPIAISVDTPEQSRDLSSKAGYTFPLLSDPKAETITRYGVLHKDGAGRGHDIARPAEFLVDHAGTVRWRNLTGDIRVRARPEEILEAARMLK